MDMGKKIKVLPISGCHGDVVFCQCSFYVSNVGRDI